MDGPLPNSQDRPDTAAVAVTGATGFIGRSLVRQLLAEGRRVRALLRPTSSAKAFHAPGLTWIEGTLEDDAALQRLVEGTGAVVHCAGTVRGRGLEDFLPVNADGVARILEATRGGGAERRLVLLSSLAAREPGLSPYAESKRRGEQVLEKSGQKDWIILRPPAVYGPGDRELLPLLQWMRKGVQFTPGRGQGRFSLIFVTDLAAAAIRCADQGRLEVPACCELHDGRPGGYSWDEAGEVIARLYGRPVRRLPIPLGLLKLLSRGNLAAARLAGYRPMLTPGKVREFAHADWVCSNEALTRLTGWQPRVSLERGLRMTLGD